jgi:predicted RNase H-like HicB family nuclease
MVQEYKAEFELEVDGRWIAEFPELPGAMAYGSTKEEAFAAAQAIALRIIADRVEQTHQGTEDLLCSRMSGWPSSKGRKVFAALVRIGWRPKTSKPGSHVKLERAGSPDFTWAFHDAVRSAHACSLASPNKLD